MDVTSTFKAFSRRFYPKRLTISTFVIRSATIYRCRYRKDVHRTKCTTSTTIARLTNSRVTAMIDDTAVATQLRV